MSSTSNSKPVVLSPGELARAEEDAARALAERYALQYVDVASFAPDPEILKSVPVELMFRHHFLFFSVTFSLFFAFSVGLTTSNFGSLVRYKIPAIPLFVASLFIIADTYDTLQREDRERMLLKEHRKPFVPS